MNEFSFWNQAFDLINKKNEIVVLIVAESNNSSPGKAGFKMIVTKDNYLFGTIGGGIMEKNMVDYAISMFAENKTFSIKRLQHSNNSELESSGLICGGFQTILFIKLNKDTLPIIKNIQNAFLDKKYGIIRISNDSFKYFDNDDSVDDLTFQYYNDKDWVYNQKIGIINTVYIIGGGHVGKAVSDIMKLIGFYVIIFDHRKNIFTMEQNISADEKIITDYSKVGNFIAENNKSFIVICTPKHSGDKEALISVLGKKVRYIGMMGSKKKIQTIFNEVRKSGFSQELINSVHSPIGLEINSDTPEEIAVSIAAEIISVKNSSKNV